MELVRDYVGKLEECGQALREMNGIYSDVLRYRYVCDYPWERIAATMNYSEQWLYELHYQALNAFYDYIPETERDPVPRAL